MGALPRGVRVTVANPFLETAMRLSAFLPGLLLACVACVLPAARANAQAIFADGFESGNTLAWQSFGEPPLVPADSFRLSTLLLRDPHVFIDIPIFGCFDFTDNALPLGLGPSLNTQLATAITTDDDGDGFLDFSLMLLGRPLSPAAVDFRLDTARGLCPAPSPPSTCALDPAEVPQTHRYSAFGSGLCLDVLAGTTSGYSPAPTPPAASCFVSAERNLGIATATLPLPLQAVQAAATFVGNPASSLSPGLLRGFLSEAVADTLLLPAEVPVVGGQPISILLPGGQGNCANHDGRDLFAGELGWWFYFNFTATPTPWTGP